MKRRNTASTQEIMNLLKFSKSALSHEMIQSKLSSIDRATIYRVLKRFHEDGIVHRVNGDDGKQYFALCSNCEAHKHVHDHFHFRCTSCGKVECLQNEITINLPEGYIMESINSLISGKCSLCT